MAEKRNVGFPLYQGCTLLDFAGATQIFAFTSTFTPFWVARDTSPIATTEGIRVLPNHTFDDHPPIDVLFVPGGGAKVADAMLDPGFQGWLKETAPAAEWVGSVCSGAFVLAAAGALEGCEVTTYWSLRETLALFPELRVAPGYPRWHVDPAKRRFSGGGISSSLDLALRLVELLAGREAAEATQLSNQYAPGPPVDAGDPSTAPPELVAKTREGQQEGFIEPIRRATLEVIGRT